MLEERLPPHDIEAEKSVVGSLLLDGEAIFEIAPFLHNEDFYSDQNRAVYSACLSLFERHWKKLAVPLI